jgi:hypothetical protein
MAVSTPAVPASTTPVTNTTGQQVSVAITGGTMTNVSVNGSTVGAGAGNYQLPPGGTISMTYTVAPTWTWTDPEDMQESGGYAQENTGAEQGTYSPETEMPLNPHGVGGFTGFGTGVSN